MVSYVELLCKILEIQLLLMGGGLGFRVSGLRVQGLGI